jgi:uncharacterized phage protein gp47/JayE
VKAGTLTSLLDRPTGLLAATNPMPASGGSDPQSVPATKQAVGVAVRTVGRLVTLADLADLAMAAGNVAKARAALLRIGQGQVLHVTVAGQQGRELGGDELARLAAAIAAAQDGTRRLLVQPYQRVPIEVRASIQLDGSLPADAVTAAARRALVSGLGFDAVGLAQTLLPSDVHAVLEAVPGVSGVTLIAFTYKRTSDAISHGAVLNASGHAAQLQARLVMFPARTSPATGVVAPADLAWVDVPGQDLSLDVKAPR